MSRRPKDRSHWGDMAFKAMHDRPTEMKLSQSGGYVVDDTGHIVPAKEIMAEVERLRKALEDLMASDLDPVEWVQAKQRARAALHGEGEK